MAHISFRIAALIVSISASSAFAQVNTSTATANGSTTIIQPITIAKNTDLAFGRIVRPATGSGTVTIANTADTVATSGGAVALASTTSRAKFTITGESGLNATLTVPSTLTLSSGANNLTVALTPDQTSPLTLGASSTILFVGGNFPVTNTTVSGAYTGTFDVTVAYQ
jgi:hypothetical protein